MKGLFKFFSKLLFKMLYRVEVKGLEHYHAVDQNEQPLLIIANHVSSLDGPMIDLFIPGETSFMVDASHTKKWYERFILSMTHYFKVDLQSPYAAKHMIKELKQGKQCMIFPEGRVTTTGSLMKMYDGTGLVAEKTGAMVLPIHISGAVYSKFSYLDGSKFAYMKQFWFPKITLTLRPAEKMQDTTGLKGHKKHRILTQQIMRLLRDGTYYGQVQNHSVFASLIPAKSFFRDKEVCVEDVNGQELSLKKLTLASIILGKQLKKVLKDEVHVGLMLPNVSGMPASFFALQAYGYVPAMINFTSGISSIKSACDTAGLKSVITSKKFVEVFELSPLIESLENEIRFI
ncbi:MAG TPA: acyl-[ACP]--phospholipid O-acyltransferase, partial [Thiomicrorhabdus sp.]|nr:acyl-[ACP]--phospholipid O-acyltransferase [Thiomicrorhabdus sp.]